MSWERLKEFKPTLFFLGKFLGLYLLLNLAYGFYVTAFKPLPDPMTQVVTVQTANALRACGWPVVNQSQRDKPTSTIYYNRIAILAVYEGCNGLNTMIIFASFVFAFGPISRKLLWFLPTGLVAIHLANLLRIGLLFYVSEYFPQYMYFTHKYVFTAFLYLIVFILWIWWVQMLAGAKR